MPRIRCSFYAGQIKVDVTNRSAWWRQMQWLGNGWRGMLFLLALGLYIFGWRPLAGMLLTIAVFWSLMVIVIRDWRQIWARQRLLLALNKEGASALELVDDLAPESDLWWRMVTALCQEQRWREAESHLQQMEPGEERDYLQAVTLLGQNRPKAVLEMCPGTSDGPWRMVKAQAHFQRQDWQRVLAMFRGRASRVSGAERVEVDWLKGASYYNLKQFKPAARLLQAVVQADGEHPQAGALLAAAQTKIK